MEIEKFIREMKEMRSENEQKQRQIEELHVQSANQENNISYLDVSINEAHAELLQKQQGIS